MDRGKNIPRLIIIQGPTGVGKSALALNLAKTWDGEIISADSMQVYRYLDIGTAKPTPREQREIKHHLLDLVDPDEPFNAALFVRAAHTAIETLHRRGTPIFVVGGTGLYIKGLLGGLFPEAPPGEEVRRHYLEMLSLYGPERLYRLLQKRDPRAASALAARDGVRIIRALEVLEATGRSITDHHRDHQFSARGYETLKIGLILPREDLYRRIEERIAGMMEAGLIEEVRGLLAKGYPDALRPLQTLNYRHLVNYLQGGCTLDEAVHLLKRDTRRYAKRQLTWFKRDGEIRWFSPAAREEIASEIAEFLLAPREKVSLT